MSLIKRNQEKRKDSERLFKKIKKQVQGITLIALVVTVIVLLILAGVAINLTVGDNGLFRRAQNAANTWQMAEQNEQKEMEQAGNFLDDYTSEYNKATTVAYAKQLNKPFENDTTITDDLDNEVRIPAGFKIAQDSATVVEDGIVIEDKDGNQFVWIPARTEDEEGNEAGATIKLSTGGTATIVYQRTAYSSNVATGEIDEKTNSEIINFSDVSNNYFTEEMPIDEESSINENGGYYIGRYESGDKEFTLAKEMRNKNSSQNNTVTIQKNQVPYNYITFNNLKNLAEQMGTSQGYATVKTKLVSSYAWDTVISFIQKVNNENCDYAINSTEGNYKDTTFEYTNLNGVQQTKNNGDETLVLTGQTKDVCNIYDLGGNLYEYTTEECSNINAQYANRGGGYGSAYNVEPAGYRNRSAGTAYISDGFRVTLYI